MSTVKLRRVVEWGEIISLFVNLPITESFVFVKCIYFFINYMNIVWINVSLILEPISTSPIFEIECHGKVGWGRNRHLGTEKYHFLLFLLVFFFFSPTVE